MTFKRFVVCSATLFFWSPREFEHFGCFKASFVGCRKTNLTSALMVRVQLVCSRISDVYKFGVVIVSQEVTFVVLYFVARLLPVIQNLLNVLLFIGRQWETWWELRRSRGSGLSRTSLGGSLLMGFPSGQFFGGHLSPRNWRRGCRFRTRSVAVADLVRIVLLLLLLSLLLLSLASLPESEACKTNRDQCG